jgi:hypothetical protein
MRKALQEKLMKAESLQSLKNSPGWKIIDEYLRGKEVRLISQLRRCAKPRMESYRGRLDELEDFMRFLDIALADGANALKQIREMENFNRLNQDT